ncbi:MAG: MFS transporter [Bdellovibrio sp. CG11_big_fil_rev_8_21_14_0_20_39_38]|nr:MAG: MFS transporter [Bdellovibrio sp. CG22_combo_CG10-13_8_21_14_all_39_27]PIR34207.1 MAG: MFS transporter [Bdellovibrio sp. CG11_big_fil_rev_8_21_14_0_20_39_38]
MPNDFKKLMLARLLFTFAVQMQAVVLGWKMYDLLGDPLALGLVGLTEAIPAIGLALYAGHIVDRSRPLIVYRRVLLVSLTSALMILLSQFYLSDLGTMGQVYALYASSFLTGVARSFSQPSMFSAVPRIIPRHQIPISSAWMSSAVQTGRIVGPALGGIMFGFAGLKMTALAICLLLVSSIIAMSLISVLKMEPQKRDPSTIQVKDHFLSGAKFVFRHPLLLPALSLDMFSVLFGGVVALLPIYCKEILLVGPKGLGLLRAAPSIGAISMSLFLTRWRYQHKAGSYLLKAVTGFGLCILVFSVSQNFILSFVALALSGAFDSVSMVVRTSIVQMFSPDDMRGRISSVNSMFIGSSNEIGEFESGVTAKLMGVVPAAVFGSVMCLVTVGIVAVLSPTLRKMNLAEVAASQSS